MYRDKLIGVNKKAERIALKVVGALMVFFVALYFAAFNYFN